MNKPDILIWEFHKAPKEYKELSNAGGDEDYVILMHKEDYENNYKLFRVIDMLGNSEEVFDIRKDDEDYCVVIISHA